MSIDTKDFSQSVPDSLPFGKDQIRLHKHRQALNFLTITFNPPKLIHGHNLNLLSPADDCKVIKGIMELLADTLGSARYLTPENWKLSHIELSQNRQHTDPLAFVFSFAKIAHLQRKSRVHTEYGTHTVAFGSKTCELKLYAKGPQFKKVYGRKFPLLIEEANKIVRFEQVSNKAGIEKLIGDRTLPMFLDFLRSDRPKEILESAWNQLPATESLDATTLTDTLLQTHSRAQTRAILGFHLLAQKIGESAAATKLGLSRPTVYNYRKFIEPYLSCHHSNGTGITYDHD